MSAPDTPRHADSDPAEGPRLAGRARGYADAARAPSTVRGYGADWRHFSAWCARMRSPALPADPQLVALYLTDLADGRRAPDGRWIERPRRVTTIARRLAAIRQRHRETGHELDDEHPALRSTWRGIRRAHAAPPEAKVPTVTEVLRALVATLPPTAAGLRDRALLLIGFAGALRRSELVAIDVGDCARHDEGLVITVRHPSSAAADRPTPAVERIGIPSGGHEATCPVRALLAWLAAADIAVGPIFRPVTRHGTIRAQRLSDRAVPLIVKRAVRAARSAALRAGNSPLAQSLDPARYAAHSLRAGFIVSAAAAGASEPAIMRQSRHKRADTLQRYVRDATLFRHNAAALVGL